MPKRIPELSPSAVKNAKAKEKPYKVADGGGMYLLVMPDRAKGWRLKYRRPVTLKKNLLSLGVYPDVSLRKARERRQEARALLADGIDLDEQRKADRQAKEVAAANFFAAVVREWLAIRKPGWTDGQHAKEQLRLTKHAFPYIGTRPVSAMDVDDVRPLIERIGHGFRHMATTLLREMGWPRDVVEVQTSHKIGGAEGVYNIAQHPPARRKMMQAWRTIWIPCATAPT